MFLYFVETTFPKLTAAELQRLGLAYAFEGSPGVRQITLGPDGKNGLLLWNKPAFKTQPTIERSQTWTKGPGKEWYVGYETLPDPQQLARPEQLVGKSILDECGRSWIVPYARQFAKLEGKWQDYCGLPMRLKLSGDGEWRPTGIHHRYERLWQLAMEYETAIAAAFDNAPENAPSVTVAFDQIDELALLGVTANYYAGPVEFDLLGAYGMTFRREAVDTIRGLSLQRELEKKTDNFGPGSSPGPEPPTTDNA
jgi:hypothetical protein